MGNVETFWTAQQSISWIAYKNTEALNYIFSVEAYKEWDYFELEELLSRLEMISHGEVIARDALAVFVDSLIAAKQKSISELVEELKQDIAKPLKYKYDEANIRTAEKVFIEALRAESLKIYGVKRIGNGNSEEIPMTFLRRPDYGIDTIKNCFYFDRKTHGELITYNMVERIEHIRDWEDLRVHSADILHLWGGEVADIKINTPPQHRRPTEAEIREIIREVYLEASESKKPNMAQADTPVRAAIHKRFGKAAGRDSVTKEDLIRKILGESEFANQRTKAGKRSKS